MRWGIAILFCIVIIIGCTNRTKVPKGVIPKDEMQELVWDVMQVDAYAKEYLSADSTKDLKKERSHLYQEVFDLHKTNREEFNKSFQYYLSRPDLIKIMYDTLSNRAGRERARSFRDLKISK